jgi:hypothetical protein
MIRAWHLSILRFAVTLDHADQLGVFAIAAGLDRLGENSDDGQSFGFFRKMSAELCTALLRRDPAGDATLAHYLARIDDPRLKRALAAAIGVEPRNATAPKRHPRPKYDLWRGLTSRRDARL